jgi:hypothetical protein
MTPGQLSSRLVDVLPEQNGRFRLWLTGAEDVAVRCPRQLMGARGCHRAGVFTAGMTRHHLHAEVAGVIDQFAPTIGDSGLGIPTVASPISPA